MIHNLSKVYEMFGREIGDFIYRTPFHKRTFKDSEGNLREVRAIEGDDDKDYFEISEPFTTRTIKEYHLVKNIRDRYLWYRREGSSDSDAIQAVAQELRIPQNQVVDELRYYGYQPQIWNHGQVPATTPPSPVQVTSPGYRDLDLPISTQSESKVITISERTSFGAGNKRVILEPGDKIQVRNSSKNRKL